MITKEKNLIKIIDTNEQEWIYDINLGQWIQGKANSNNETVRFSMYADNRTNNVCRYIALTICRFKEGNIHGDKILWFEFYPRWWCGGDNADFIRYIDKCTSANLPCLPLLRDYSPDYNTIMTHLNEYAALVENISVGNYFRLCDDLPTYYQSEPFPEYEMDDKAESIVATWSHHRYLLDIIRKYAPHYEKQFLSLECQDKDDVYYLCTREEIVNNPRYLEIALYYFFKLLPYYRITNNDAVRQPIGEYIKRCDFLKIPPRKESNFIKLLIDTDKEYQTKKREFDKQLLVERYAPHLYNLAFENDKYIIVIPLTEEAFIEEARVQRNCVYSGYYPSIIDKEDRSMRIVFMRKKEDINTPYVTIEVDLQNNGWHRIEQALQKNNADVESQEAQEFIAKYEEHLQTYYPITHNNDDIEDSWTF